MATATDVSILEAQAREPGNKNAARRVRVAGKIPAVVYGAGKDTTTVAVDPRQVLRKTVPLFASPKQSRTLPAARIAPRARP